MLTKEELEEQLEASEKYIHNEWKTFLNEAKDHAMVFNDELCISTDTMMNQLKNIEEAQKHRRMLKLILEKK